MEKKGKQKRGKKGQNESPEQLEALTQEAREDTPTYKPPKEETEESKQLGNSNLSIDIEEEDDEFNIDFTSPKIMNPNIKEGDKLESITAPIIEEEKKSLKKKSTTPKKVKAPKAEKVGLSVTLEDVEKSKVTSRISTDSASEGEDQKNKEDKENQKNRKAKPSKGTIIPTKEVFISSKLVATEAEPEPEETMAAANESLPKPDIWEEELSSELEEARGERHPLEVSTPTIPNEFPEESPVENEKSQEKLNSGKRGRPKKKAAEETKSVKQDDLPTLQNQEEPDMVEEDTKLKDKSSKRAKTIKKEPVSSKINLIERKAKAVERKGKKEIEITKVKKTTLVKKKKNTTNLTTKNSKIKGNKADNVVEGSSTKLASEGPIEERAAVNTQNIQDVQGRKDPEEKGISVMVETDEVDDKKKKLSLKMPKLAKQLGIKPILIVLGTIIFSLVAYYYGYPYAIKAYNWTMGIDSSIPNKEGLLDKKKPPTKEEKKIIDQNMNDKEVKSNDSTLLEVVTQNKVSMNKVQLERTPLGVKNLQPRNLKQNKTDGIPSVGENGNTVPKTYTKWPQNAFQFIRVKTKISDIYTSKVNPQKRYIKIEDPNNNELFVTAETSTPTLVNLIDKGEIKTGDPAIITLSTLSPTLKNRYLRERETVSRWFNTATNHIFSIEEYEIPKN